MTKHEYKELLNKDFTLWTQQECISADMLIKQETLRNFNKEIEKLNIPVAVEEYLITTVRATFFSRDTEVLLDSLKCFPDWKRK